MGADTGRPSVLVVDDDLVVRSLVKGWFGRQGYRVQCCASARAARDLLEGEAATVDVLVVDFHLGDGLATGVIGAAAPRTTIVLSGDLEVAARLPAHAAFLAKPFSAFDLAMALDRAHRRAPVDGEAPTAPLQAAAWF